MTDCSNGAWAFKAHSPYLPARAESVLQGWSRNVLARAGADADHRTTCPHDWAVLVTKTVNMLANVPEEGLSDRMIRVLRSCSVRDVDGSAHAAYGAQMHHSLFDLNILLENNSLGMGGWSQVDQEDYTKLVEDFLFARLAWHLTHPDLKPGTLLNTQPKQILAMIAESIGKPVLAAAPELDRAYIKGVFAECRLGTFDKKRIHAESAVGGYSPENLSCVVDTINNLFPEIGVWQTFTLLAEHHKC